MKLQHHGNKTRAALALLCFVFTAAAARAENECATPASATAFVATMDANIQKAKVALKANEAGREAAIDKKVAALVASGQWKKSDQQAAFQRVMSSDAFRSLETQKQPHMKKFIEAASSAQASGASNPVKACGLAKDALGVLSDIAKLNQSQYDLLDRAVTAERPR